MGAVLHANALFQAVARGTQQQAAAFLASGGTVVSHPEPAPLCEFPLLGPLPEALR